MFPHLIRTLLDEESFIKFEIFHLIQVEELHRLYRTQKVLMRDAKQDRQSWKQPVFSNSKEELTLDADEGSDLELTLATGSHRTQRKKTSASNASESGSSFSSSSCESASTKAKNSDWTMPDGSIRIGGERKRTGFKIEQTRQDGLKQTSWLFPCSKQHDMVASFGL